MGPALRVISVEPEEANFAWRSRSVIESDYTNVELRRAALGAEEGNGTLHMGRRSGLHSMLDGLQDRGEGLQTVPVITMDDIGGPINAVKIDVEGFEEQVLAGAERTLADPDLRMLFMDLHPQLGADNRRVLRRLTDSGFDLCEPSRPYQRLQQPEVRREALAIRG